VLIRENLWRKGFSSAPLCALCGEAGFAFGFPFWLLTSWLLTSFSLVWPIAKLSIALLGFPLRSSASSVVILRVCLCITGFLVKSVLIRVNLWRKGFPLRSSAFLCGFKALVSITATLLERMQLETAPSC
jgi:hypothetical protein